MHKNPSKKDISLENPGKQEVFPPPMSIGTLFWKATLLAFFFAFLMLLVTGLVIGVWGYGKLKKFSEASGVPISELKQTLEESWASSPTQTDGFKNILLLGVDSIEGRGNAPALTDTMLLLSIDVQSGSIQTLSLPRDLWHQEYQTKINALYFYGQERYPDHPEQFPKEVIEDMTGVTIHHTIVLSLDTVQKLIDQVGGVTVDIPTGFIDTTFPRPGVDVTVVRDPAILYETVEFQPGKQTLSGERALQYIRSRHSEGEIGTDISRGERQQLILKSLFTQLSETDQYLAHPEKAGGLYRFYLDTFSHALSVQELLSTLKTLYPKKESITFSSHQLSTTKEQPQTGVLDNPRPSARYQNQWVYVITNPETFKKEVQQALFP